MALVLGLWLAITSGVWLFVKYHRHFPEVRYADLLLPGRWAAYRASEGDYYITQAAELVHRGEAHAALYQLRAGVSRAPANARGRSLLAELYLSSRRPDLAREVLLDGLRYQTGNPAYLQSTLSFLLESQEDAKLLEVAGAQLASPAHAASHPMAATYAATAAYYRGNYDQAEDFLRQYHLRDTPRWRGPARSDRLGARLSRTGPAAVEGPARARTRPRRRANPAAGCYRELGRTAELETTIVERLVSDPLAAAPRLEHLRLLQQRGDREKLARDAESYLDRFQHDPAALLLLADFAANTGRPALVRRVQQTFTDRQDNHGAPALLVAEAHLVTGEYQATLSQLDGYARDYPEWAGPFASVLHGLQTVALCGLGRRDEARLSLEHLLTGKNLRADNLVAVADRLTALGARDLAFSALGRAVEAVPPNQAALTRLIRLELDTGNVAALPVHLDRFLQTRRPSREILARAYATLGSDRHLFLPAQAGQLAALRTALASRRP
jgi:Tfp pilus assembly protein PilF